MFPNETFGGTQAQTPINFNNLTPQNQFQNLNNLSQIQNWNNPEITGSNPANLMTINNENFSVTNTQSLNIPNNNNEVGILANLDSKEIFEINTEELVGFDLQDNISERLSNNLCLNENRDVMARNSQNMTDSLTRIATDTLNSFLE